MDFLTIIIGSVFLLVLLIYWHVNKCYDYWKARGVIYKKPFFIFGSIYERVIMTISFHDFIKDFYDEMKSNPYAGVYEGTLPVLYVCDPDLIKQVLVKHFDHFTDRPILRFNSKAFLHKMMASLRGAEWKKTRVACTPAFSSGRLKAMIPLIDACGQQMIQYLNSSTEATGEMEGDIKEILINYTLNVIASTAFGVNLNSFSAEQTEFAKRALTIQDSSICKRLTILLCIMYRVPQWITSKLPLTIFNDESIECFARTLLETRKYRTENNVRRNDLLQLLLDAQAAPVEVIGETDEDVTSEKREVIDEETAIAQSVFFFIAGFETSSTHVSMACYELAKNKDIQDKVRQDILKHWNDEEGLTYEAINSMSYLDMVMSETLRLYPPLARLERTVTKPIKLGDLNLDIDTKIVIPVMGLHYDSKHYPEPLSFKPERFSHEEKMKRNPYAYLAFGAGPRNCIGMRFAGLNSKICTAYLLKHYEIDICDKTPIPLELSKRAVFLKSKDDIYLKLRKI